MTGIIGAMEEEVVALKKTMDLKQKKEIGNMEFYVGKINSHETVVVKCGIGKVNAALCTQILIDNFKIDEIINIGVAGSLTKTLNIGDIVISQNAVQHDFDTTAFGDKVGYISRLGMKDCFFEADERLINKAQLAAQKIEGIKVSVGTVASGDQFVADKIVKDRIVNNFSALCVEMEGAAIAHACYINNIPFVIIRSISDNADESANMSFEEFTLLAAANSTKIIENMFL